MAQLVVITFDAEFSRLTSSEFIQQILIEKINTRKLVIGYDHRFGRNREGGFDYLMAHQAELGFAVEEIPKQTLEEVAVSSTKIRQALQEGGVRTATKYLGRPYSLRGTVQPGNQLGRTIGFPTANLQLTDAYKLVPAQGTYAVSVHCEGRDYEGMMNIGLRPTVSDAKALSLEVHLFDVQLDLYGKELTVLFVARLREEQKFADLETLKMQLQKDRLHAKAIFQQPDTDA